MSDNAISNNEHFSGVNIHVNKELFTYIKSKTNFINTELNSRDIKDIHLNDLKTIFTKLGIKQDIINLMFTKISEIYKNDESKIKNLYSLVLKSANKLESFFTDYIPCLINDNYKEYQVAYIKKDAIHCLISCMFLFTTDGFNTNNYADKHSNYTFSSLIKEIIDYDPSKKVNTEKLKSFITYLVNYNNITDVNFKNRYLCFILRHYKFNLNNDNEETQYKEPLNKITFTEGNIEDSPYGINADFANKFIGGGVLSRGSVQEEILFTVKPECVVAGLICDFMKENNSIFIAGASKFLTHTGYGGSLKINDDFNNDRHKKTGTVIIGSKSMNIEIDSIVAFDSIDLRTHDKAYSDGDPKTVAHETIKLSKEYRQMKTDFNKLNAAFKQIKVYFPEEINTRIINTGNWGGGAFLCRSEIKALIQWVVANIHDINLNYYHFNESDITDNFNSFYNIIYNNNFTKYDIIHAFDYMCTLMVSSNTKMLKLDSNNYHDLFIILMYIHKIENIVNNYTKYKDLLVNKYKITDYINNIEIFIRKYKTLYGYYIQKFIDYNLYYNYDYHKKFIEKYYDNSSIVDNKGITFHTFEHKPISGALAYVGPQESIHSFAPRSSGIASHSDRIMHDEDGSEDIRPATVSSTASTPVFRAAGRANLVSASANNSAGAPIADVRGRSSSLRDADDSPLEDTSGTVSMTNLATTSRAALVPGASSRVVMPFIKAAPRATLVVAPVVVSGAALETISGSIPGAASGTSHVPVVASGSAHDSAPVAAPRAAPVVAPVAASGDAPVAAPRAAPVVAPVAASGDAPVVAPEPTVNFRVALEGVDLLGDNDSDDEEY